MQRIAITGSSGYLGGKLVAEMRRLYADAEILGLDICEPKEPEGYDFQQVDISSPDLVEALKAFQPDTIIHSAFVFSPMRDTQKMRHINVEGSRNVFAAAAELKPKRLMLISSATAYGAWPDNPLPIEEDHPLRACKFQYAADKTEVEGLTTEFAAAHPEIAVSSVRPAIIGGPNMNNYLKRFIFGMPILVMIGGNDTPMQFVHEQDVIRAIIEILKHDGKGPFNIGPPDWTLVSEVAKETDRRVIKLPFWLVKSLHSFAWFLRLPIHESPGTFLQFARYSWTVAPTRLVNELGFKFDFSSHETMLEIIGGNEESNQDEHTDDNQANDA